MFRPNGMPPSANGTMSPSKRQMTEVKGRTQRNDVPGQRIDFGHGSSVIAALTNSGNTSAAGRPDRRMTAK